MLRSSFIIALCNYTSIGSNFILQALLLYYLGEKNYANIGYIHLLFVSLIFLSDLGFNTYFYQFGLATSSFKKKWFLSVYARVGISLPSIIFLEYYFQGLETSIPSSLRYLYYAALLLAQVNIAPSLICDKLIRQGALALYSGFPIALIIFVISVYTGFGINIDKNELFVFCVFNGFCVQFCFNIYYLLKYVKDIDLKFKFKPFCSLLVIVLSISSISISSLISERVTLFIFENTDASDLSSFILYTQIFAALLVPVTTINRLLMSAQSKYLIAQQERDWKYLFQKLFFHFSILYLLTCTLLYYLLSYLGAPQFSEDSYVILIALFYTLGVVSSFYAYQMISDGEEKKLANIIIGGSLISIILQVLFFHSHGIILLLRIFPQILILLLIGGLSTLMPIVVVLIYGTLLVTSVYYEAYYCIIPLVYLALMKFFETMKSVNTAWKYT